MSLLEIRNLRTHLPTPGGVARAVDGVDLVIGEGESVGLVGESGSGKTVLALSILDLLPGRKGAIQEGSSILFRGKELVGLGKKDLRQIRGGEIAMIFQEPMTSLNPVFTIGNQVGEAVGLHQGLRGGEAGAEVVRLLEEVGIPGPTGVEKAYPHQLSGGLRQRVMVAMALAGNPALLIADEPTTALDVTVQAQVLDLLRDLQERLGMALLLVSHDLGVVSRICQRIVVLYGGRVAEVGTTEEVLESPAHPYTRGLLGSRLSPEDRRRALRPIPGEVPEATAWPPGCRFHPRCPAVMEKCQTRTPPLLPASSAGSGGWVAAEGPNGDRRVRCWLLSEPKRDGSP